MQRVLGINTLYTNVRAKITPDNKKKPQTRTHAPQPLSCRHHYPRLFPAPRPRHVARYPPSHCLALHHLPRRSLLLMRKLMIVGGTCPLPKPRCVRSSPGRGTVVNASEPPVSRPPPRGRRPDIARPELQGGYRPPVRQSVVIPYQEPCEITFFRYLPREASFRCISSLP